MQHSQLPARQMDAWRCRPKMICHTPSTFTAAVSSPCISSITPLTVRCRCTTTTGATPSPSGAASAAEVSAAWKLLKTFTEQEFRGKAQHYIKDSSSRAKLREALMLAYSNPNMEESWSPSSAPEVLLGVVASEGRLAVRALRDWCQALDLEYVQPDCKAAGAGSLAAVKGAVYIKYNSISKVCYLTSYQGVDRGVLVQLGQGRLLGHFPLGLFDEHMKNPEPAFGAQASLQQNAAAAATATAAEEGKEQL